MDDPNRQRRQNDVPMHPSSNPRYHQPGQDPSQQRRSYGGGAAADRFRPSPINTSAAAAARGMSGSAAYSGYYQDTAPNTFPAATGMPQGAMGYHQPAADYGQDARQTQGFANAYNQASMMYNVPQASTQSSVYDTSHQFSSRQPAALQMMATDVTAPYFQSEPANAAAAQGIPPQTASAGASAGVYQQGQADRSSMLQSYAGQMASMGGMGSQQQQQQASTASAADTSMEEQEYRAPGGLEEAYASYQTALKEIFQNIINGVLASASDSLLNVSDWLLSHVAELGLNMDDQSLHADRIKLWNDFNHAWLALLQKQKDMMESGQQLQRSQSLVSQESLEKMGKELVRLCDGIERHGLVDYQYGVWEEQIIAILTECLDLYETPGAGGDAAGSTSHRA